MAAKDKTKKKKAKAPKGFAEIPEWWMEITPHNTLYPDEDEVKRHNASQEAKMYKDLAAKSDFVQANESKYALGENGELIDKKTGKPIEIGGNSGFTKNEKSGEWMKDGEPMFGRKLNHVSTSTSYGHKDMSWKQPDWMKVSSYFAQRLLSVGSELKMNDCSNFYRLFLKVLRRKRAHRISTIFVIFYPAG